MRHWWAAVPLAAFYSWASGDFGAENVALGAVLGLLVVGFLHERGRGGVSLRGLLWAPVFVAGAAAEILRGSVTMVTLLLDRSRWNRAGTIEIPVSAESEAGALTVAIVFTASPGTAVVDVDHEKRVYLVHAVDVTDPQAIERSFRRFYDVYQRRMLA